MTMRLRTRFAPSPTGDLHLGGALCALAAFVRARASGGTFVVRMEDLDPPRVVAGAAERILDDLAWLGLDEDEGPRVGGPYGPYVQSARGDRYAAAIEALRALGARERVARVYECTCSRAEIARAASAPHAGEEGPRYPGLCRDGARAPGRPAALRLRVPEVQGDARRRVRFEDLVRGPIEEDVSASVGDFVLRRADGVWAYQLAVAVDDGAMAIDEVWRGDDLLGSTARQILLQRLLELPSPRYGHLPVVRGPDGERLAKRHQSGLRGSTIAELRADGVSADEILGELAFALGLAERAAPSARAAVVEAARAKAISPRPWPLPARWIRARS
jgi:glutamyl-tRNA synthetase